MDVSTEAVAHLDAGAEVTDLEGMFRAHYARLARVIGRVIKDPARAEEIAVDVLLKWSRFPAAAGPGAPGWLHRTAVRMALDELRRQARRERFGWLARSWRRPDTPEETHLIREEQENVRAVLAHLRRRHAELLVLRSHGLSYEELAATLRLNPASVGTLLGRAQRAFRKEYEKRYGHTR